MTLPFLIRPNFEDPLGFHCTFNDRTINSMTLNEPDILKNRLMAGYTEISSPVTGS